MILLPIRPVDPKTKILGGSDFGGDDILSSTRV
jgi:hypothetical protein